MELKAKYIVRGVEPKFGSELLHLEAAGQDAGKWNNDMPAGRITVGNPTKIGALKEGDEVEVTLRAQGKSELEKAEEKLPDTAVPNVENTPENLKDKEPGAVLGPKTEGNATPLSSEKPDDKKEVKPELKHEANHSKHETGKKK